VRITRLALRDFRRYRELEIPFSNGLTIVHGPNEAGKTTIQRAIEMALTRKVTSGGADMDALRPWDAGDDARPEIHLTFEIEDEERGLRQGTLDKVFRGPKGTVRLEIDGETITDPTLADQALAEMTGIPSEAFFRSTASVRHHELADLDRDEAALRDRLQASISGADRGTSRAKK
jgi:DNA repair exonuclease SbcCD ATPase subunit